MSLAWQCGEWDWETLQEKMPARCLTGWMRWLQKRPQSQRHRDELLTRLVGVLAACHGHRINVDEILGIDKPPREESQAEIDRRIESSLAGYAKKNGITLNVKSRRSGDNAGDGHSAL